MERQNTGKKDKRTRMPGKQKTPFLTAWAHIKWFFTSKGMKIFYKICGFLAIAGVTVGIIGIVVFAYILNSYEDVALRNTFIGLTLNETSYIIAYDKETGEEIEVEQLYKDEDREWITYSKIKSENDYFIYGTIAIEDERFFQHEGVDWKRFIGAVVNHFLKYTDKYGGSTITMQLIKNVTGDDDSSIQRKAKEVFRATYLEKLYEKEDILEFYLNTVNYGGQIQGIVSASRYYFNKTPGELSLIETASIIGITNNPSLYRPTISEKTTQNNLARAKLIVQKMWELGYISEEEYNEAMAVETIDFNITNTAVQTSVQSYYVDAVIDQVLTDLQTLKGYSETEAKSKLYNGGLRIYIPQDLEIQEIMDSYYKDYEIFPDISYKDDDGNTVRIQSAMVIMDYNTGEVLGMVGGIGEKTYDRGFNRATAAYRQLGSVIKPLAFFAPAIDSGGISPGQSLDDAPIQAYKTLKNGKETNEWWPHNFVERFRGMVTVREAIKRSLNGPVADGMTNYYSTQEAYDFMKSSIGFTRLADNDALHPMLALGKVDQGVSPLSVCAAYQIFPNNGVYTEPIIYNRITDSTGAVLIEKRTNSNIAISSQTAYIMRDLLKSVVYDSGATASRAKITDSDGKTITVRGKTGTSDSNHDFWFAGFTKHYLGSIWIGYDDNTVMPESYESAVSAGVWAKIMQDIHRTKGLTDEEFERPHGVSQIEVCKYSGKLAGEYCRLDVRGGTITETEWIIDEYKPTETCDMHKPVYMCGNRVAHDSCPEASLRLASMLNVRREYAIDAVVVEDAGYVMPELEPETILYVDPRWPVYMNIYAEGKYPALPKSNYMNTCCTVHAPSAEPHLHPKNFELTE